jgi:hypothetical protein
MIELKITIKDDITKDLQRISAGLKHLPSDAYNYFVAQTPIKTGNARRSTVLHQNVISADYAYAQRLDDGYSQQAPKGMTKPTEAYIDKTIRKLLGK